jgi:hypothetical protein
VARTARVARVAEVADVAEVAEVADVADVASASRRRRPSHPGLRAALATPSAVRRAILLREIIGPPASLWGPQDGPPGVR